MLGEFYSPEVVDGVQATPNYIQYRSTLEGGPHGAIHSAIGGDMGPATSPNGIFSNIFLLTSYLHFSRG